MRGLARLFAGGSILAASVVLAAPTSAQQAPALADEAQTTSTPATTGEAGSQGVSPPGATAGGVPVTAESSDRQPGAASEGDIVVTGSRIARRDYTSASPIVTTSQDSLRATGKVNVEDALLDQPQFTPAQGSTTNVLGGGGRATLNLRGLGEQRNLVLLDGKRLPLSNAFGVVDVNNVPIGVLQGVEVITGGASAVYGSDAISGVVNFKTRQRLKGLEADAQYRLSSRGDAAQSDFTLAGGTDFAGARGNVLLSLGYTHRDELIGYKRSFYQNGVPSGNIAGGSASFGTNLPSQAAVNNVFGRYGLAPGSAAASSSFGFNDDGTLYAIRGGANAQVPSNYGIVNGSVVEYTAVNNTIVSPQNRYSAFGHATFDVTPDLTVYAQGLYVRSESRTAQNYPTAVPALSIPITNPFISADLRTLLASRANPNANLTLAKRFESTPKRYYEEDFDTWQVLGGVKGRITNSLNFDIYASHDETVNHETLTSAVRLSRLNALLNASDGGRSLCAGGFNPFGIAGSAAISQECLNYITTAVNNRLQTKQDIVEGTITGTLFKLPADDLRFSITADYRHQSLDYAPDALLAPLPGTTATDLSATVPTLATTGSTNVKEIAGELLVPILKGSILADELNLSLGYRYSDYNVTGGQSTYKAEADWTIRRGLLLRGGYEHAIRAPNIGELFSAPSAGVVGLGAAPSAGDPCDVRFSGRNAQLRGLCIATGIPAAAVDTYTQTAATVQATQTGNRDLAPEIADTYTAGIVLSPKFQTPLLSNISLSVDYYNIKIDRAISPLPGASVVSKCYNTDGSNPTYSPTNYYCSLITRDTGDYTLRNVNTPYSNLGGYRTSGIDFQLDARWNLSDLGIGRDAGSLILSSVFNYLDDFKIQLLPGAAFQDFKGTVSSSAQSVGSFFPRWRGLTTLTYRLGGAEIGVRWRYVDSMKDSTSVTSPATAAPGVPSYNSFDLVGRARINDRFELRGGVTNIADKKPLVVAGTAGTTNPAIYDVIGRALYIGAHVKF